MAWDAFNILVVATAATAATERVLNAGLCAGARRVRFRYVHVPKSGGMTLTCTLDSEYRRGLLPCHQLKNFHVPVELEARHRTYDEYLLEAGAIGDVKVLQGDFGFSGMGQSAEDMAAKRAIHNPSMSCYVAQTAPLAFGAYNREEESNLPPPNFFFCDASFCDTTIRNKCQSLFPRPRDRHKKTITVT